MEGEGEKEYEVENGLENDIENDIKSNRFDVLNDGELDSLAANRVAKSTTTKTRWAVKIMKGNFEQF